jgi:SAM-dependent methyltransferase
MTHVDVASFERLYEADPDPWDFASSSYEQRRYDLTVAALPRQRYRRAFEPGCAIGELTRRLAARCDRVDAIDAAPTAVAVARRRCADLSNVRIDLGELPPDWPEGRFDLVVLSEIGYYFTLPALGELRDLAVTALEPGGALVGVHWRGASEAHELPAEVVHDCLRDSNQLRPAGRYEDEGFLLELWERS